MRVNSHPFAIGEAIKESFLNELAVLWVFEVRIDENLEDVIVVKHLKSSDPGVAIGNRIEETDN